MVYAKQGIKFNKTFFKENLYKKSKNALYVTEPFLMPCLSLLDHSISKPHNQILQCGENPSNCRIGKHGDILWSLIET